MVGKRSKGKNIQKETYISTSLISIKLCYYLENDITIQIKYFMSLLYNYKQIIIFITMLQLENAFEGFDIERYHMWRHVRVDKNENSFNKTTQKVFK